MATQTQVVDTEVLAIRIHPELKTLLNAEAEAKGLWGMGEMVTRILARHFRRPDLARVPRRRVGRPRKRAAGGEP